nr:MAG TPA: hypothetical protein [Caudoviricetes sp.]
MNTPVRVKALRVSLFQLIDIVLGHGFKGHPEAGSRLGHIPQYITQLVQELIRVEVMALELDLFEKVNTLTGLSVQAVAPVSDLVPRAEIAGGALGGFLVLIQRHASPPPFPLRS